MTLTAARRRASARGCCPRARRSSGAARVACAGRPRSEWPMSAARAAAQCPTSARRPPRRRAAPRRGPARPSSTRLPLRLSSTRRQSRSRQRRARVAPQRRRRSWRRCSSLAAGRKAPATSRAAAPPGTQVRRVGSKLPSARTPAVRAGRPDRPGRAGVARRSVGKATVASVSYAAPLPRRDFADDELSTCVSFRVLTYDRAALPFNCQALSPYRFGDFWCVYLSAPSGRPSYLVAKPCGAGSEARAEDHRGRCAHALSRWTTCPSGSK